MYTNSLAKKFFSILMEDIVSHQFSAKVDIAKGGEDCYYDACDVGSGFKGTFEVSFKL